MAEFKKTLEGLKILQKYFIDIQNEYDILSLECETVLCVNAEVSKEDETILKKLVGI